MQDTQLRSLDWEDPLEMGTATHSSIPAWRIPWTVDHEGLQSMGTQLSNSHFCRVTICHQNKYTCGKEMGHYDLLQKHKRQKMGMFWENGEILAALFKNSILI